MRKIIYHYCSYDTFKNIILFNSLRLSDITKSNDSMELNYYFKPYSSISSMKQLCKENTEAAKYWEDAGKYLEEYSEGWKCYAICFGQENMLTSWDRYGDRSRGISIGFNLEILHSMKETNMIEQVIDTEGIKDILAPNKCYNMDLIEIDNESPKKDKLILGKIQYEKPIKSYLTYKSQILVEKTRESEILLENLIFKSAFIKDRAFRDEREFRMAYLIETQNIDSIKERFGDKIVNTNIPNKVQEEIKDTTYFDLKFPKNCISKVYIGPNCTEEEKNVLKFLRDNGYSNCKVEKSNIPYRLKEIIE